MDLTNLYAVSAVDAARLIREGVISSAQLVDACLGRIEAVDACAPEVFVLREQRAGAGDHRGIRPDESLAAFRALDDQLGRLKHRDVLLDRRERHVVIGGECRDGLLALESAAQDVAPRRGRERVEDAVDPIIAELRLCNHLVVR